MESLPSGSQIEGSECLTFLDLQNRILLLRSDSASGKFQIRREVSIMAALARQLGVNKVLLTGGDLVGDYTLVQMAKEFAQQSGIELAWLDYQHFDARVATASGLELVNAYLMKDAEEVGLSPFRWESIRQKEIVLPLLVAQAKRIQQIKSSIDDEEEELQNYPIIRPITILKRLARDGLENDTIIQAKSVIAFDSERDKCLICTKSVNVPCVVVTDYYGINDPISELLDRGLTIGFDEAKPLVVRGLLAGSLFKVSTRAGNQWFRQRHPPLDPGDPNLKFIPLWERVK